MTSTTSEQMPKIYKSFKHPETGLLLQCPQCNSGSIFEQVSEEAPSMCVCIECGALVNARVNIKMES